MRTISLYGTCTVQSLQPNQHTQNTISYILQYIQTDSHNTMPIPPSCKHILDSGLTAKGEPRQFVKHSYKDRAREEDGPLSKKDEIILAQYDEDCVGGIFPLKLLIILKILEREGMDHIFSWLPHGRAFGIHKLGLFEEVVMKRFFKQNQISSFRRQLNLYGFLRLSNGRDSGAYYHELFLRGRPLLSMKMVRTRIKGTKIRASSSPADEPQFYSMPFLGPGVRPSAQKSVQERNNSLFLMMRGNVNVQNPNVPSCSMMGNSTQDQLSMLMNRNLLNSYLNSRPSFGNNFNSNPFSMNSFEALGRSLDQRRNDLRNQLLNPNVESQNLMNSLNVPPMNNSNDSNNMASLMAQARYLHELSLMRNNLAAGAGSMLPNQLFPQQNNLPTPSFLMKGLEKQNRPSSPLGVKEDIAATSMLSMSSSDGSGAPAGGVILPYPTIPQQKNLPTPSVLMKGL